MVFYLNLEEFGVLIVIFPGAISIDYYSHPSCNSILLKYNNFYILINKIHETKSNLDYVSFADLSTYELFGLVANVMRNTAVFSCKHSLSYFVT